MSPTRKSAALGLYVALTTGACTPDRHEVKSAPDAMAQAQHSTSGQTLPDSGQGATAEASDRPDGAVGSSSASTSGAAEGSTGVPEATSTVPVSTNTNPAVDSGTEADASDDAGANETTCGQSPDGGTLCEDAASPCDSGVCAATGTKEIGEGCATNDECASEKCAQAINNALLCCESNCEGTCQPSELVCEAQTFACTPHVEDDGCPEDQWCKRVDIGEGTECVPQGSEELGDECQADSDCNSGLFCFNGFECRRLCDADADRESPGGCGIGFACNRSYEMGVDPMNIGECLGTCEYGVTSCAVEGETCTIAPLASAGEDVCTTNGLPEVGPVGDACNDDPGAFCGGKHICLETASSPSLCLELCRASEGPLGIDNHPDCLDAVFTTCQAAFGADANVGVCVDPM